MFRARRRNRRLRRERRTAERRSLSDSATVGERASFEVRFVFGVLLRAAESRRTSYSSESTVVRLQAAAELRSAWTDECVRPYTTWTGEAPLPTRTILMVLCRSPWSRRFGLRQRLETLLVFFCGD